MSESKVYERWLEPFASASGGIVAKQWFFTGFVLAISALLSVSGPSYVLSGAYMGAIAALVGVSIGASFVPWRSLPSAWAAAPPVLDIAVAGVMRDVFRVEAQAVALIAFLPALLLAYTFRHIGNAVATAALTVALSVPTLVHAYPDINSLVVTRSILVPLILPRRDFSLPWRVPTPWPNIVIASPCSAKRRYSCEPHWRRRHS